MLRSRYACLAHYNAHSSHAVQVPRTGSCHSPSRLAQKELHNSAHAAVCSGLTLQAWLCLGPI